MPIAYPHRQAGDLRAEFFCACRSPGPGTPALTVAELSLLPPLSAYGQPGGTCGRR